VHPPPTAVDPKEPHPSQLHEVELNEHGLFALTGVDGRVVFEYLPESKTFDCLSTIHSFRGGLMIAKVRPFPTVWQVGRVFIRSP